MLRTLSVKPVVAGGPHPGCARNHALLAWRRELAGVSEAGSPDDAAVTGPAGCPWRLLLVIAGLCLPTLFHAMNPDTSVAFAVVLAGVWGGVTIVWLL